MRLRPSALLFGLGLALASFSPTPPGDRDRRPEVPSPEATADPARLAAQEQALQTAARADDADGALDFFRTRTPSAAQRQRLRALVRHLADDSFELRQQASAELAASGPVAAALLRRATRDPDPEVARRAHACRPPAAHDNTILVHLSAVQLVVRRRPPGTVATLLAYLPFAEDEGVAEEVRRSLAALTARDGKPEPALLQALAGADPDQRAEAGVILTRADLGETRAAVRRLLEDEDASVRLRVGRALVEAKERNAIPVLIELFGDLAGEDRWDLEDLLERVAGERAPAVPRDDDDATRHRRRDAWRGWWQAHGATVDLTRPVAPPRPRGRMLLVLANLMTSEGQVQEVRSDGRPPRRIDGLNGPIAAEGLPGDRVLIAEYAGRRVGERTLDGKVLWEKDLPANPVAVQRLPNGNTFVACRNRLLEIDRDGQETVTHTRTVRDVVGARKHADGSTALLTDDGLCRWLDPGGNEVGRFPAGGPHVMGAAIDVLPNKRVLVPRFGQDRVTEYDAAGAVLWEAAVPGAASAERLPDGHTLVGATRPPLVVELDRLGRVVWEYRPDRAVIQATRR
jgi:hypothetical protein